MNREQFLISTLPNAEGAERFLQQLAVSAPSAITALRKDEGLFSDVLTLSAFSPLLAATLLKDPEHIAWLGRKRREGEARTKDDLRESLARFSLTNSQLDPRVRFSKFRRRELLRIYLRDIRRVSTITEVTEEISDLADVILDAALDLAKQEADSRFGQPQVSDAGGRLRRAGFCVVALGKLGSHELNYSSDIDLVFLYSGEGDTSGSGSRGRVTNREYFEKFAQILIKLIGDQTGDGSAYRVDLRLRPFGSLGPIAMSLEDTERYYRETARSWERQVLIRSRGCAGDVELYKTIFAAIEERVFSRSETVESALASVRRSKDLIDRELLAKHTGFDVKLGPGGIREIEFIAQALQLAYGGKDIWLRSPHTLVSLARLADRGHILRPELTQLTEAYDLLRRTEHVLQMENGIQTHVIPEASDARSLLAARMEFVTGFEFGSALSTSTSNVRQIFERVFDSTTVVDRTPERESVNDQTPVLHLLSNTAPQRDIKERPEAAGIADQIRGVSPHFAAMLAASPSLSAEFVSAFDQTDEAIDEPNFDLLPLDGEDFAGRLGALRRHWARHLIRIAAGDIAGHLSLDESRSLQNALAEASVSAALVIVRDELARRTGRPIAELGLLVLALGKLGGRSVDFGSDLDLVLAFEENSSEFDAEYYARASELLITTLSSMTRDGSLYRVDLRLRPFGSKGTSVISRSAFADYMRSTAAVWELLAFVKIRGIVSTEAEVIENEIRSIIHQRASTIGREKLRDETLSMRRSLEQRRGRLRRSGEIDIKYGEGGMLDIYFAMRFLQLRDNVPDDRTDRSTVFMLSRLLESGSLTREAHSALIDGYSFLSHLDHLIRLTIGRSTRVPTGNSAVLSSIAARMSFDTPNALLAELSIHRMSIREAYGSILS